MVKLDHIGIAVKDWRTSRDWYVQNLGLKIEFEAPTGGQSKSGVAALQDDSGLTLFVEQSTDAPARCRCAHNFQVDDVGAKYRELSARDVEFLKRPQNLYWGYGAELVDPDGHLVMMWDEKSMRKSMREKGGGKEKARSASHGKVSRSR
ncbi:MAG TPA: VOC family protein [Candidatus Binataceae bacterium]